MVDFIHASTSNYGKVKLVLKKNRYFIESPFPEVLKKLIRDETIYRARLVPEVENVKERCLPNALNYPMLEEYDFRNDTVNPDLDMELKPQAQPRPYQEKSLSKMFGNVTVNEVEALYELFKKLSSSKKDEFTENETHAISFPIWMLSY